MKILQKSYKKDEDNTYGRINFRNFIFDYYLRGIPR